METSLWFSSWASLLKITISSIVGYLLLILYIRLVGKRATSKMNNFDWIVSVAIGSILASLVILKDVSISDGALAMGWLIGLQFLLTQATTRWTWARRLFLARPSLLYIQGEFVESEMSKQRVSREEILSAIRESGASDMDEIFAVTLEPDAEMAVVKRNRDGRFETWDLIERYPRSDELRAPP
jgi:uncharacterized membrane protein YcaP (DUF421 family)